MASIPGIAGAGAPYPQWGVIVGSPGQHVTEVVNAAAKYLMESTAFPSRVYFFTSAQAAQDWVNGNGGQHYVPGTQTKLNAANAGINAAATVVETPIDLAHALGKVLHWISNRGNIVRVIKVTAGAGMILVGINMLATRESNVLNAAETVAKVVK